MSDQPPLWRSMLFVPAHVERFVNKAHQRGADAIILDLEDSVPLPEKAHARAQVASAARQVAQSGADVVVRINAGLLLAAEDLAVSIDSAVQAICVPKTTSGAQLQWISEAIDELERERGLTAGHTRLIALIESTDALSQLADIARSTPRLAAIILGSEDFSASAGMLPTADGLLFPNQQIVFAARAAGVLPLGFVGSIADYSDLQAFRTTIKRSSNLGLRGGFCIHPSQVAIMNEEFSPADAEVSEARELLAVYEAALSAGRGAAEFNGKMIDAPVVARSRELLAFAQRIAER